MQSATWSKAVVRMGTDKYGGNGELTCWSAAISRITISRASGATPNYLSPVGRQPNDRRKSQRARGVIAPLSASFASEAPGERTGVRDPGTERRKARGSKRERPVNRRPALLRVLNRASLADDRDFDLTGVGHLFFDAGTDVFGEHLGIAFTDFFRSDDDADLATCLKSEA